MRGLKDKPMPLWLKRRIKYGYADGSEIKKYFSPGVESTTKPIIYMCPNKCQHCGPMIRCPKTTH